MYVEAKAILQKEHITLLRKKGYAFGAFWRISLVTFFETLTFLTYCKGRPKAINTGLLGILPVSQAPQNLFDEDDLKTTRRESSKAIEM